MPWTLLLRSCRSCKRGKSVGVAMNGGRFYWFSRLRNQASWEHDFIQRKEKYETRHRTSRVTIKNQPGVLQKKMKTFQEQNFFIIKRGRRPPAGPSFGPSAVTGCCYNARTIPYRPKEIPPSACFLLSRLFLICHLALAVLSIHTKPLP
jgi:hypothetical protein